jgi:hypothetical protein
MFFLNNLGTLLVVFLFYFISIMFLMLLDCFVENRPRIGRLHDKIRDSLFYNTFVSLMMESYGVMAICVMINLEYIRWESFGE